MNNRYKFFIFIFIFGIIFGTMFVSYSYTSYKKNLVDKTSDQLESMMEDKTQKINLYLSDIESDISMLRESDDVKNLLKQELVYDEVGIKQDVNIKAQIIAKEVENYIKAHPDQTLNDLKESKEFNEIAIQPVGNEGYGVIVDYDTQIILMHKFPEFIGNDFNDFNDEFPELYNLQMETKIHSNVFGFYDWKDVSGELRRKYAHFINIKTKTADGVGLIFLATAYADDYKIVSVNSEYLENFHHKHVDLISPDGYVIYTNSQDRNIGINLNWKENSDMGLAKIYFYAKQTEDGLFYGPYIEKQGSIYPKISLISPVYENGVLLGYVVILEDMKEIYDFLKETKIPFSKTEESYLINEELLLISPSMNENINVLVQTVDTQGTRDCVEDLEHYYDSESEEVEEHEEEVEIFLDYRGEEVFSSHGYIPKTKWCLLSEIDVDEVLSPLKEHVEKKMYFSALVIIILSIIAYLIGMYFDNNNAKLNKTKWFNKLKVFFRNLNFTYYILISAILCAGYLFISMYFFPTDGVVIKYSEISNAIIAFILMLLFFYAFRIKNAKARTHIFLGSLFLIINKFVLIGFQEHIFIEELMSSWICYTGSFLGLIGLILIIYGFAEVVK